MADVYGWQDYIYRAAKNVYNNPNPTKEMYAAASSEVSTIGGSFSEIPENKSVPMRIAKALDFLNTAIAIERNKEAKFLVMLQKQIKDNFSKDDATRLEQYTNNNNNWKLFIQELQLVIGEQRKTVKNIHSLIGEMDTTVEKLSPKKHKQQLTSRIINNILKSFSSEELSQLIIEIINNNKDVLNSLPIHQGDSAALQKAIQSLTLNAIVNWAQHSNNLTKTGLIEEIKNYMQQTNNFESIETIEDIEKRLIVLAEKIPKAEQQKNNLQLSEKTRKTAERQYNRYIQEQQQLEEASQLFNTASKNIDDEIKKSVTLIKAKTDFQEQDFIAEVMGAVEHALLPTFSAGIQLGQQYAKPDVLIGHVQIEIDRAVDKITNTAKQEYDNAMLQYLNNYSKNMNRANTYEYYKKRADEIRNLPIPEEFENLSNWFVIEESTKAYEKVQNNSSSSFTGGSLGPNLSDQLTKISAIITSLDNNNLINNDEIINTTASNFSWFLVNTLNGLIAENYKEKLLLYLSAFVTIFLFDDQLIIWEETIQKQFNDSYKTEGHRLHLFSLNQEYFPLSFVLQAVYDRIASNFNNTTFDSILAKSGATVIMTNIPTIKAKGKKNDYHTPGVPQKYAGQIKLQVEFLNNFQGLIQALYG